MTLKKKKKRMTLNGPAQSRGLYSADRDIGGIPCGGWGVGSDPRCRGLRTEF